MCRWWKCFDDSGLTIWPRGAAGIGRPASFVDGEKVEVLAPILFIVLGLMQLFVQPRLVLMKKQHVNDGGDL